MQSISTEGKYFDSIHSIDLFVDGFEKFLNSLKPLSADNKYVVFAVRDLSWIALGIISHIARNLHWRYSAYAAATMTRLLMECVAEIKYIQTHPKKAKNFWMSQQKIQNAMREAGENRWGLFSDGTLSKYGRLSDSTNSRVLNMLGQEDFERYNFLNFYSHPNIAGYMWVAADNTQPGVVTRFIAETFFKMIEEMLSAESNIESQTFNFDKTIKFLRSAYLQYINECEGQ